LNRRPPQTTLTPPVHGTKPQGRAPRRAVHEGISDSAARSRRGEQPPGPLESEDEGPETRLYEDRSKSILAENDSPDVPFRFSLNPYRGCEHGCVYCYARPTHEYLDLSAGVDFESRILVKTRAPELLEETFRDPGWEPQVVALSGNTDPYPDPYQPAEEELKLTRRCLEVFSRWGNPVAVITKNHRITRDVDLLSEMARRDLVSVRVSVTTLRRDLARAMEPRTSRPSRRLEAIRTLSDHGVPVGVNAAPMIPGLTDEELPAILEAAADHGARSAAYILVRLPGPVKKLFRAWLEATHPERASKVLRQIRATRGGRMNDPRFGSRMRGEGDVAKMLEQLFSTTCDRLGLDESTARLTTEGFRRPPGVQRDLFRREG